MAQNAYPIQAKTRQHEFPAKMGKSVKMDTKFHKPLIILLRNSSFPSIIYQM